MQRSTDRGQQLKTDVLDIALDHGAGLVVAGHQRARQSVSAVEALHVWRTLEREPTGCAVTLAAGKKLVVS